MLDLFFPSKHGSGLTWRHHVGGVRISSAAVSCSRYWLTAFIPDQSNVDTSGGKIGGGVLLFLFFLFLLFLPCLPRLARDFLEDFFPLIPEREPGPCLFPGGASVIWTKSTMAGLRENTELRYHLKRPPEHPMLHPTPVMCGDLLQVGCSLLSTKCDVKLHFFVNVQLPPEKKKKNQTRDGCSSVFSK